MTARKSGVVIPNRLSWHQRLAIIALSNMARLMMASWRIRWDKTLEKSVVDGPAIFCIWHNRLAVAIAVWKFIVQPKWPVSGLTALVSASKDGAILAEVVENFGLKTVRGSSSRRGGQALLEASTCLEDNYHVAITPDGPRGPCYKVQPGIIQLAQLTGRPVVAVSSYLHNKYCFKSWDRFQLPLPFSRVDLRISRPIYVPRGAGEAQREAIRQELERTMMGLTLD